MDFLQRKFAAQFQYRLFVCGWERGGDTARWIGGADTNVENDGEAGVVVPLDCDLHVATA
jgi:hypothetical protein